MDRTLDRTLDALRRVRDARQRKAAIEKIRQERVAAQTAQTVADARSRMMAEIAARLALAQRVNREAGIGGVTTPRALADTFSEDMSRTRAAGLARLDVMRAGEVHQREQATLAQLQQRLGRAQANLEKIDRVADDRQRTAARRADAREDDEADAAALRRGGVVRTVLDGSRDDGTNPASPATEATWWRRDADRS